MRYFKSWTAVQRAIIVALTFVVCASACEAASDSRYMHIGANALAPVAFVEFCVRKPERCVPDNTVHPVPLGPTNLKQLNAVNQTVNRSISPLLDLPALDRIWHDDAKRGYCTEYSLTKRSQLLDLGWPSSSLLLAIVIIPSQDAHLVLIVVTDSGEFVLDNLRANVLLWDKLPYQWVKRSSPKNPLAWQAIITPTAPSEADQVVAGHYRPSCPLSG